MMWVVLQNRTGAVNLMHVIDIFVQRNTIIARIAPNAKDTMSTISLGGYSDGAKCKLVLNEILKFIAHSETAGYQKVFKMPMEDDEL